MSAPAEGVFVALADPTRWRVLSLLAERGEGTATSLAGELPVTRVAVVKHLAVLDRAGLVESRREGREVLYTVCTQPLGEQAEHAPAGRVRQRDEHPLRRRAHHTATLWAYSRSSPVSNSQPLVLPS